MTDNQTVDKLNLIIQALEKYIAFTPSFYDVGKEALDAARELRELGLDYEPEQEPVKDWIASHDDICALLRQAHDALALTSYPPQRRWIGMTDEERNEMIGRIQHDQYTRQRDLIVSTQIITEMYLKEKNT